MPFGNTSLPARVYRYGCRLLPESRDRIYDLLRAGQRYRNKLVEIELARRAEVETLLKALAPQLAELDATIAALDKQIETRLETIRATRQRARTRTAATAEDREALATLRAERKNHYATRKQLRQETFASVEWKAAQATIEATHKVRTKEARAASGCNWGTYLVVEQSLSGIRTGAPPRFRRDTGGRVAVQLQKGLSTAAAMDGSDARLAITPEGRYYRVRIRVAKGEFIEVSAKLHRPLPEADIKWCTLVCERVGTHDKWTIHFTLASASGWGKQHGSGAVAINLGWRTRPEGIRAAYWRDTAGREGEWVLPAEHVGALAKAESLRSIRDKNFDTVRLQLGNWLKTTSELPEWLVEATQTLAQWRSPARLAAVALRWRAERATGDDEMFSIVEAWRKQDRHLYDWESFARRRFLLWRRNQYRVWADELAKRYDELRIAKISWKRIQDKPAADEPDELRVARQRKRLVSPSELESALTQRFARIERCEAADLTSTCHVCGEPSGTPNPESLFHTCRHCATTYDQDANHCANLLAAECASGEVAHAV